MLKKIIYKKNYQKGPCLSGGTSGQTTRITCRLGQIWQALAATPSADMLADDHRRRPLFSQSRQYPALRLSSQG
jgi:hypothetical protein